ncbi:MAG: hypothetical protein A2Z25_09375 [Planctomycetes bacterium RBG_16_55_9]|nr:MAG: hypothetical protein A2Z25_09375 [Planctomycetes bacterium RBG_16_55_9]
MSTQIPLPKSQPKSMYLFRFFTTASVVSMLIAFAAHAEIYPLALQDPAASGFSINNPTNASRGWRFRVNDPDVYVTELGVHSPISSQVSQTLTLFDFASEAVLAQVTTTPGPDWIFEDLAAPVALTQGSEYIVSLYFGDTGGYYYGSRAEIGNSWFPTGTIEYLDVRYANNVGASDFPINSLADYLYGIPDIGYEVGPTQVIPAPGAFLLGLLGLSATGLKVRKWL